jgi:hypothetical protein
VLLVLSQDIYKKIIQVGREFLMNKKEGLEYGGKIQFDHHIKKVDEGAKESLNICHDSLGMMKFLERL